MANPPALVPVTIVTGFLGAGKTTLLNLLLANRGDKSISVIENEDGAVSINSQLVDDQHEKEDVLSLTHGCMCCSLRQDLLKAFGEIDVRSKQRGRPVDSIIIETTGVADPAPIALTFVTNPWVAARFKLDSIICVIDSQNILQAGEDGRPEGLLAEAFQQIAFSDTILLNKVDMVSGEDLAFVKHAIRRINATARIFPVQLNQADHHAPLDALLNSGAFDADRSFEMMQNSPRQAASVFSSPSEGSPSGFQSSPAAATMDHHQDHEAAPNSSAESLHGGQPTLPMSRDGSCRSLHSLDSCPSSPRISPIVGNKRRSVDMDLLQNRQRKRLHDFGGLSSVCVTTVGDFDEAKLNTFMRQLLSDRATDIFRTKGVLHVHGYEGQKFVFHGVHETISYGPRPCTTTPCSEENSQPGEGQKINHMVFIGRALDKKALTEGIRACLYADLPAGWEEFRCPRTRRFFYFHRNSGEKTWTHPALSYDPKGHSCGGGGLPPRPSAALAFNRGAQNSNHRTHVAP